MGKINPRKNLLAQSGARKSNYSLIIAVRHYSGHQCNVDRQMARISGNIVILGRKEKIGVGKAYFFCYLQGPFAIKTSPNQDSGNPRHQF